MAMTSTTPPPKPKHPGWVYGCHACRPQEDGRPRPVHQLATGWQKDLDRHHALLASKEAELGEALRRLSAMWDESLGHSCWSHVSKMGIQTAKFLAAHPPREEKP